MPVKQVSVPNIGLIQITKRKTNRSIRLSVGADGQVKVSIPTWVPYQAGIRFAQTKSEWITKQRAEHHQTFLESGQALGKAHHLYLQTSPTAETVSSRLKETQALVVYPENLATTDPAVQKIARQVAIRALRSEAEALLPQRLQMLATEGEFSYQSVQVKQLKRRWGSCSQRGEIVLNLFLMQLPWPLIDYVLWHELTHTKQLHHGAGFWDELTRHVPTAKQLRRQIKQYNTDIR
jgi:predicted metal-dependent hydrolase